MGVLRGLKKDEGFNSSPPMRQKLDSGLSFFFSFLIGYTLYSSGPERKGHLTTREVLILGVLSQRLLNDCRVPSEIYMGNKDLPRKSVKNGRGRLPG